MDDGARLSYAQLGVPHYELYNHGRWTIGSGSRMRHRIVGSV